MLHTPRAQLSAAALRRPSKLRQMVSLSLWLCSLTPSAPRMKARPLELPAMRPVSGVDRTSIRFFQTPVRMKRENTAPEKHRAKKKGRFFKWWHTQNTQGEHKCQGWVSQQQLASGLILQETAQVLTALFLPSYPFFPSLSHLSFAMQLLALSVTAGQIQTHNITEAWLYLKPAGFLSTFLQTYSAAGHETYKCSSVMFCNHECTSKYNIFKKPACLDHAALLWDTSANVVVSTDYQRSTLVAITGSANSSKVPQKYNPNMKTLWMKSCWLRRIKY